MSFVCVKPDEAAKAVEKILEQYGRENSFRLSLGAHSHDRPEAWDEAEQILKHALADQPHEVLKGDAAYDGPRIEIFKHPGDDDAIACVQLNFFLAIRFDLKYLASDGSVHRPWMIVHRTLQDELTCPRSKATGSEDPARSRLRSGEDAAS